MLLFDIQDSDFIVTKQSFNQFNISSKAGFSHFYHSVKGGSFALSLVEIAKQSEGLLVVILNDPSSVLSLRRELEFFLGKSSSAIESVDLNSEIPIVTLPDWETLPYDYFSPHQDIISERLETLYQLPRLNKGILILPISSALQKLPPREYIELQSLILEKNQSINLNKLRELLDNNGYSCVNKVMQHGEYAVRGSIIDLFPMGVNNPIRIELFDDEIESLRFFDAESQLTKHLTNQIKLLPAREYPTNEDAISLFRESWRSRFDSDVMSAPIYRDVSCGIFPAGIDYYLPLFFEQLSTIFDYLPETNCHLISKEKPETTIQAFWLELNERYEQYRHDLERPIVNPKDLYLQQDEFNQRCRQYSNIKLSDELLGKSAQSVDLNFKPCPDVFVDHKLTQPLSKLNEQCSKFKHVLLCAESTGRQEVIRELLTKHQISVHSIQNWQDFIHSKQPINLLHCQLTQGFSHGETLVICESDLFGRHVLMDRRRRGDKVISPDQLIHSLAELKIGDPVVHVEQGVGRYRGLQTIDAGGITTEFLTLEYSGGGKLYVPVQSLHQIHRYSGSNPELAPWHKLGSESWGKAKRKAIEKARDTAAELLDIYARRGAEIGYKHKLDPLDYEAFAAEFPFELTADQDTAIKAVVKDMTSSQPMDRLVCGDVGFGKTEVAMRAAFISMQNGLQVAMLVPTTLLAQQHFGSFQDRFANLPINIAVLSRFQTKKEQNETLAKLESGQVDLVIGTHRLISGNLKFKNLGLLLIDEEHRFGVRQKEILKSYRTKVDILTLTATPIPRTLNISMSGMRDLSIIATPPAKRLAIKTFVRQRNDPLIKEAIQREVRRGGQVYFLHNSVETIDKTAADIQQMMPEVQIAVAHGQMRERKLEDVMQQFYHHRFHVLVCTTIIETGIDIPTANTIIMDRADKLGLAQLHQLRGRVGRSHHQAYAYLLTPPEKTITRDAKKRLEAIEKLEDLGAGFILATHDLEIRGAGELLGDEQSGHMQTIGFSLYMELLERAIAALKSGQDPSLKESQNQHAEVNLGISALLPDDYVPDVSIRLSLYKRIASAKNAATLRELQVELIDRFGLLPNPAKNLFMVTELKNKLAKHDIIKLDASEDSFSMEFSAKPNIDTGKLIELIQSNPSRYRLAKGTLLKVQQPASDPSERLQQIDSLIETLSL